MHSTNASHEAHLPRAVQWSAVLFALGFPSAFTWVYFVAFAGDHPVAQHVTYAAGKLVQFLFPVAWVVFIERRRMRLYLPTTSGLALGMISGVVVALVMIAAYSCWLAPALDSIGTTHEVKEKLTAFQIDTPAKMIAMGVFYAFFHSLLEEYYWRWFVFGEVRRLVPLSAAIVISSVAFMGHHAIVLRLYLPLPWAILASAAVAIGGAMWAWLYHRSGSIYAPWISHLLIDAAIFVIAFNMVFGLH
jgi:membrane protease YdiL (CAAX protease family)